MTLVVLRRTAKALAQDKPVLKSTCRDGEGLAALYLDRFNELKDESAALGIWLLPHIRHASKEVRARAFTRARMSCSAAGKCDCDSATVCHTNLQFAQ